MSAIIYILPGDRKPTGGAKTMLQHVALLERLGFNAFAVSAGPFAQWADTSATIYRGSDRRASATPGAMVVLPETDDVRARLVADVPWLRRIVFCQNHHFVSRGALADPTAFRVDSVFCCADAVARALSDRLSRAAPVVPCAVDSVRFAPARTKRPIIAAMPRKRPQDWQRIEAGLRQGLARGTRVPWRIATIRDMDERQVAAVLAEASVFVALGRDEGLGLPPLEAMLSECLVAGFHGGGGLEYATAENGSWHDDADIDGVVAGTLSAVSLVETGGNALHRRIAAGRATAMRYSVEEQERRLVAFWMDEIRQAGREPGFYRRRPVPCAAAG